MINLICLSLLHILFAEPYLLILEYVMYGKLLTHLREQRSRGQTSLFDEFTGGAPGTDDILGDDSITQDGLDAGGGRGSSSNSITAKDLTKYAYGVAKGMEYLVSKSVSASIISIYN